MSFKCTSRHHGWYAAQVSHGTTYVVLTLSLLIRPVWPSTYDELVSLRKKNTHPVRANVVSFSIHLIPGLFLSIFTALTASQAEVAHSESRANKSIRGGVCFRNNMFVLFPALHSLACVAMR